MKHWTNSVSRIKLLGVAVALAGISACRSYHPQEGDLLFQDLDCGPLCNAIERVEKGYGNLPVSHVGIVVKYHGKWYVAEAYRKVQKTPLGEFLHRSTDAHGNPKIMVGRIKKQYSTYTARFKQILDTLYGKPYDDEFMINNGKYYCCELVYEVFRNNRGKHLFDLQPMQFSKQKNSIDSVWIKYFNKLKKPIPLNKPGCNPSHYSKSGKLKIIAILGDFTGK